MLFKPAEKKPFGTKPSTPAPAAAANGNVNVLLKDLIITITALRDVLLRENDALGATNTRAFMDIQDEKVSTARKYEALMVELMSREDIKNADPQIKKQLFALEKGFTDVMKDNMRNLERMKSATEKLGERIMKSARKSAESMTQFAYGSAGTMQKGNKASIGVSEQA